MPVVLDVNKRFLQIDIYYVEEIKKSGTASLSVFKFIHSQEDMDFWKSKGYKLKSDTEPSGDKQIGKISSQWKRLTWKEQNTIYAACYRSFQSKDGKSTIDLDYLKFRDMKFKTCIKAWDIKNDDGTPYPLTEDTIDGMPPEFANEFLDSFERVTEITEGDLKN